MSNVQKKALDALVFYAEGGTLLDALRKAGIGSPEFYAFKRTSIELDNLFKDIQKDRADMMVDECYSLASGDIDNPRITAVRSNIRLKIAGFYDRARFGERQVVEHDLSPDLAAAISAARARVPVLSVPSIDAEFQEIMIDPFTGKPVVSQGA